MRRAAASHSGVDRSGSRRDASPRAYFPSFASPAAAADASVDAAAASEAHFTRGELSAITQQRPQQLLAHSAAAQPSVLPFNARETDRHGQNCGQYAWGDNASVVNPTTTQLSSPHLLHSPHSSHPPHDVAAGLNTSLVTPLSPVCATTPLPLACPGTASTPTPSKMLASPNATSAFMAQFKQATPVSRSGGRNRSSSRPAPARRLNYSPATEKRQGANGQEPAAASASEKVSRPMSASSGMKSTQHASTKLSCNPLNSDNLSTRPSSALNEPAAAIPSSNGASAAAAAAAPMLSAASSVGDWKEGDWVWVRDPDSGRVYQGRITHDWKDNHLSRSGVSDKRFFVKETEDKQAVRFEAKDLMRTRPNQPVDLSLSRSQSSSSSSQSSKRSRPNKERCEREHPETKAKRLARDVERKRAALKRASKLAENGNESDAPITIDSDEEQVDSNPTLLKFSSSVPASHAEHPQPQQSQLTPPVSGSKKKTTAKRSGGRSKLHSRAHASAVNESTEDGSPTRPAEFLQPLEELCAGGQADRKSKRLTQAHQWTTTLNNATFKSAHRTGLQKWTAKGVPLDEADAMRKAYVQQVTGEGHQRNVTDDQIADRLAPTMRDPRRWAKRTVQWHLAHLTHCPPNGQSGQSPWNVSSPLTVDLFFQLDSADPKALGYVAMTADLYFLITGFHATRQQTTHT
jgi:hypothetical protein